MRSRLGRLAVIGITTVAVAAIAASPALATTATTLPATSITTTSAVLNGLVGTETVATAWEFQYGTTTSYGNATPIRVIHGNRGTVHVSARIRDLAPGTTYHFRLLAQTSSGSYYYPFNITYGADETFTTKGILTLLSADLGVRRGVVSVPLRCESSDNCSGRLSIRTAGAARVIRCASTAFTINAGVSQTVRARVTRACLVRLAKALDHQINASLTANLRTGQPTLEAPVTLTLK